MDNRAFRMFLHVLRTVLFVARRSSFAFGTLSAVLRQRIHHRIADVQKSKEKAKEATMAEPYQVEVFPWFEVVVGNLATIAGFFTLLDSAFVYLKWTSWIEFRDPFSLLINDVSWVCGAILMFVGFRDWLAALPFAEEKRRGVNLDELLWRTTYDPITRNWCFLLLVILFALKSCGSVQVYSAEKVLSRVDEIGTTNGEALHDYIVYRMRALYIEKFAERVKQMISFDTYKALMTFLVVTVTISSEIAYGVSKQLVRTAERNMNRPPERLRLPMRAADRLILVALMMPVYAFMSGMSASMKAMSVLMSAGNLFRRFYSDKLFSNYTRSFPAQANIKLPMMYTCLSTITLYVPIGFVFLWIDEMDWFEMVVMVSMSFYSVANADATQKLNQYRRRLETSE